MNAKIYILLPVHNRRAITEKFVDCLVAQLYTNYHLILIDDGSVDGTDAMVSAKIGSLTVIKGKGNWWWAGSLQQGINWLKCNDVNDDDIVFFMNDDVEFDSNFLQTAVSLVYDSTSIYLPHALNQLTSEVEETGVHADLAKRTFSTAASPEQINCMPTRGLFMRMTALRRVGGFYPKLLPHYLSDYEFTIRAHRIGLKLRTMPTLLIKYDGVASGIQSYENLTIFAFIKSIFSIKSRFCPIYWTNFVLLTSPIPSMPWRVLQVWLTTANLVFKQVKYLVR